MGSYSSNYTSTEVTDKRLAVESGWGVTADNSTVTIQSADPRIVQSAMDAVSIANATAGDGFARLLQTTERLFAGGQAATVDAVQSAVTAASESRGVFDQKSIIILAVAGLVALVMIRGGRA